MEAPPEGPPPAEVPVAAARRAVAAAAVAELGWLDRDGRIHVTAAVPLLDGGDAVVVLPFADAGTARHLTAAAAVALVLSDGRLSGRGWLPLATAVDVDVAADRDGSWVATGLLGQLLAKHPPCRALLDSPLLRREHWWAVPRWIVRMPLEQAAAGVGRRWGVDDGVLLADVGGRLRADTVSVDDWDAPAPVVRSLTGRAPTAAAGRSAVLFTHDLSVPDREVTAALLLRGRGSANGRLAIDSREGSRVLPGPPSLLQRLRNQARASRDCRRQLSRADVAGGDYP